MRMMDSSTPYLQRFGGIARLFGNQALKRLASAHVAVIGIGGVGSWAAEALVRSGIGTLTLIDMDDVCITNTNRQLHALTDKIGRPKVEVVAERMRAINPQCNVHPIAEFFTETTANRHLEPRYDFVVDATDRMTTKALIIHGCRERDLRVLTVGGTGGRRDPTQIRCVDLGKTNNDPLLRSVRRELRREHGWASGKKNRYDVPSIFSAEPQVFPHANGEVCATPEAETSLKMDCASGFGAASFVTGAFGFAAAGEIVRRIALGDS